MRKAEKFNEIYARYGKFIFAVIRSILKDENVADAMQECCIRIYKSADCFGDLEAKETRSLVSIIARNAAIDMYRKVSKIEHSEIEFLEEMAGTSEDAADEVIRAEDLDGLEKYAKLLDDSSRSVLILKYYYGFTYKEIGVILGMTEINAKVRMSRTRTKLRESIRKGELKNE